MTKAKHKAIVEATIRKCLNQGFDPGQMSDAIVTKMELALELEADEREAGIIDFPVTPAQAVPERKHDPVDKLAPPPPAKSPNAKSSLIIAPDSQEAREAFNRKPVEFPDTYRPGPPRSLKDPNAPHRYWDQTQLSQYIMDNTAAVIQVPVEGRSMPVSLLRNVEVQPGVDTVRVSYSLGPENQPVASQPNSALGGEALPMIAVDTPVFQSFTCFDRDQPIQEKMDKIFETAAVVYSPKPEHLESRTPRRQGHIRYSLDNPHDSTPPLANPLTGKLDWSPGSKLIE